MRKLHLTRIEKKKRVQRRDSNQAKQLGTETAIGEHMSLWLKGFTVRVSLMIETVSDAVT